MSMHDRRIVGEVAATMSRFFRLNDKLAEIQFEKVDYGQVVCRLFLRNGHVVDSAPVGSHIHRALRESIALTDALARFEQLDAYAERDAKFTEAVQLRGEVEFGRAMRAAVMGRHAVTRRAWPASKTVRLEVMRSTADGALPCFVVRDVKTGQRGHYTPTPEDMLAHDWIVPAIASSNPSGAAIADGCADENAKASAEAWAKQKARFAPVVGVDLAPYPQTMPGGITDGLAEARTTAGAPECSPFIVGSPDAGSGA